MTAECFCHCGAIQPCPEMSSDDPRGVICQLCGAEIFTPLRAKPGWPYPPPPPDLTLWQQLVKWWQGPGV